MKPVSARFFAMLAVTMIVRAEDASTRHFPERVQPLLDSRCVSCHGPDKVKGALRLDSREAALKGGETGPAIVPGKPDESLLLQAVLHSRKDLAMPPKEKLTANDVAVLRRWILDGAPWPRPAAEISAAPAVPGGERLGDAWHDERNPIVRIFGGQRLDLWSFRPVGRVEPPAVKNRRWVRNPIDAFILARIEGAGLKPSPEADKRTLARRLHFDLTGLPPTPDEMALFLADRRHDAFERLVDRLLASPRYGEHWARQWLDVVRYSDSNGFDWDEFRPRAWRFRDYVIRSFNSDKPFGRFVQEQLAGDELVEGAPVNSAGRDALIATGYLRLGPQDNSAALFNEQARSRAELMADLVETTGSAFLGLTMSCCRCHDHKFDPLSQADHYRLRAFFEPVKYADETPLDLAEEQESIRRHNAEIEARIKPLKEQREQLLGAARKRLRDERVARLTAAERELLDTPKEKRTGPLAEKTEAVEKKIAPSEKEVADALGDDGKSRRETLTKEIDGINKAKREFTLGLLMSDSADKVPATHILFQGDYKAERAAVEPGFPSALDPNPAGIRKGANPKTTGRRLTLARWISAPDNPLTARVLVNRVWQGHFGSGLVATPNDFGLAGARPSHPELLDWLAGEFTREGGSLKKLHRLIVTSATYRQTSGAAAGGAGRHATSAVTTARATGGTGGKRAASKVAADTENALYARQNPRRLSAEQLRDALFAVSGSLKEREGGPPIWPRLPPEVLQANPAFLDDNETKTKGWYPSDDSEQRVRSIYLVQKKTVRVPFMETFDLPENSVSCPRRTESIVAPQALSLLNSPMAVEAARALAARVERDAGGDASRQVDRAFTLALQRPPDAGERRACAELHRQRGLTELCRALLNLNEFIYVD